MTATLGIKKAKREAENTLYYMARMSFVVAQHQCSAKVIYEIANSV